MKVLLQRFLTTSCLSAVMLAAWGGHANPVDGVVASGSATITSSGSTLNIHQSTDKAVIDWGGFDIGAGETTAFHQPGSGSVTLNRVHSAGPSVIDGNLTANGNIFIVNQNGVLFGAGSRVDVNGLVVSTADISNSNFNAGHYRFDQPGNPTATIENRGLITAREAGLVGMVAPNVTNSGIIAARLGRVHLASGDTATVDLYGDGLMEVAVSDAVTEQLVKNTGTITAEGGTIALTAAAGANVVNSLIHVSGELRAPSVGVKNGKIIIAAEGSNAVKGNIAADKGQKAGASTVIVDGVLDVSGVHPGEIGGSVTITADRIAIMETAQIDASGASGGGVVHIGGEYLGLGSTPTADVTIMQSGARISAEALIEGNGGEVILYADNRTEFGGTIDASGAGEQGDGGFVETSGKNTLLAFGNVRVIAGRNGKAGTWLLDPADITITAATDSAITGDPNFTATSTGSQVSVTSILANLDNHANVTITTTNNIHAGSGDILVNADIVTTGTGSLTLSAYRNVDVNNAITLNTGNLTLRSNNAGAADGSTGVGRVAVNAAINTNGGNITIGGGNGAISAGVGYAVGTDKVGVLIAGTLNAGNGHIVVNGKGANLLSNGNYGVQIDSLTSTTGSGTISIYGIGGGGTDSNNNHGIYMTSGVTSIHGNVVLNGTGGGTGAGSQNYGVTFSSGGGRVHTSGNGNISITGVGGNTLATNVGVVINYHDAIRTTGSGTITVHGTGRGTGVSNYGVLLGSTATGGIASAGGDISVTGIGSMTSTGSNNYGVLLNADAAAFNSSITNAGSGKITIIGDGGGVSGGFGGGSSGVGLRNNALISTVNGLLSITGTGGIGSGGTHYGVVLSSTGASVTTSGTGGIYVKGTGGTGADSNGVVVNYLEALKTTGSGSITIDGTGGGSYGDGVVVGLSAVGTIVSAGGAIDITGQGTMVGTSSGKHGIYVGVVAGAAITNVGTGTITLNGTGGSTGNGGTNYGVYVAGGAVISTVNGELNVTGTGGGSGTAADNYGVYITGANSTIRTMGSGELKVTGNGGNLAGSGGINHGVYLDTANGLRTAGTGHITVTGTKGGQSSSYGIYANAANSVVTAGTAGNITLRTDTISLGLANNINSVGSLTVAPKTTGTMAVGTTGSTLNLSDTQLGYLNAASYIFGSINAGDVTVSTGFNFADKNVTFLSGGNINLASTLTKSSGAGTANYLFRAYGNVTNSGGAGVNATSGAVNLTMTSDDDVSGVGSITLTSAPLTVNGGTITLNSNGQSMTQSGSIGGDTTINSGNGAVSIGMLNGDTTGTRSLTVNAGTATVTTTDVIGGTHKLYNLTLVSNDVALGANIGGTGTLTLEPYATASEVRINDATAGGTYVLSSPELGYFVDGWGNIRIGKATGSGSMYMGATSWTDPVTFLNNFRTNMSGALTGSGNASVTFTIGSNGWLNADTITTAGQNVTFDGAGTMTFVNGITTGGGSISVAGTVQFNAAAASPTWSTSGGNISFGGAISRNTSGGSAAAQTFTLNAGIGTISFGGTVNGDYNLTAAGSSITTSGAWGGSEGLGNINLTSANSISLPAITTQAGKTVNVTVTGAGAASITTTGAIATGALGNISLTSNDLILGGSLSGTGTLTLQPYGTARTVRVASGSDDGTNWNLSGPEIGYFTNGWELINIGRTNTANYAYFGASDWVDPVNFRSNSGRYIDGNISGTGNASITFSGGWVNIRANSIISTVGQTIDFTLAGINADSSGGTIRSNTGNILLRSLEYRAATNNFTIDSGGGDISFSQFLSQNGSTAGKNLTLNAGAGTITFNSTIDAAYNLAITAGTVNFLGAVGGTTPLGSLTLTSTNSLTLPSITAASILARTTGVASDITIASGSVLTASGAGDAITLASGQNFINDSGSLTPLVLSGGGRFLIYSTNPASDALVGMTGSFVRYGCTYGGSCPAGVSIPGANNGFIYVYRPTLTVTPVASSLNVGDPVPAMVGYARAISGYLTGAAGNESGLDNITGTLTGVTNYTVTSPDGTYYINYNSGTFSSALGYQFSYANNASGIVVGTGIAAGGGSGTASGSSVVPSNVEAILSAVLSSNPWAASAFPSDYSGQQVRYVIGGEDSLGAVETQGVSYGDYRAHDYRRIGSNASVVIYVAPALAHALGLSSQDFAGDSYKEI